MDYASALSTFLAVQARSSVVRLRDPELDGGVFTGFFISPAGHLITAFHSVKSHFLADGESFPLEILVATADDRRTVTTRAYCPSGCHDRLADWALLKLDLEPSGYLPLSTPGRLTAEDIDCAPLRVYGFTVVGGGEAGLGSLSGEFLRAVPDRRRFRVAFSVRSQGQSGGPVIDLRSHTVVGSVVGFREDERLTADAALLDRSALPAEALGIDLDKLAAAWRRQAVTHLVSTHPELSRLGTAPAPLSLPECHLSRRQLVREVHDGLMNGVGGGMLLHGPPGSGKSVLAVELVRDLLQRDVVDSVFWYDFEPPANRSPEHLVIRLALHLLEHQGVLEPIDACIDDSFARDISPARRAVVSAVRHGRHVIVIDNCHVPQRANAQAVIDLLAELLWATGAGESLVVLTSWDRPSPSLNVPVTEVAGLAADEVSPYLGLHGIEVSPATAAWLTDLASDITCVEQFVRTPGWQKSAERGRLEAGEPAELHRYWLNRYMAEIPEGAQRILLALAVIAAPVTRDVIERTAAIESFAATLDTLTHSPPLVMAVDGVFQIHSNVTRAVLATTDQELVTQARMRAAAELQASGFSLAAARLLMDAREHEEAVRLLFAERDEIIARGGAGALGAAVDRVIAESPTAASWLPKLHAVMASFESIRGNYEQAAKHWANALRAQEGNLTAAAMHNRRADVFRMASRYVEADREYGAAARAARAGRTEEPAVAAQEAGWASLGRAKLERLRANYPAAERRYREAEDAFRICLHQTGLIEAEFGIGEVHRLIEEWPAARLAYQRSLERAVSRENEERHAYALWGLGEVARLIGEYDTAARHHLDGLERCGQVGDVRSEGWALLGLAETQRATGHLSDAVRLYDDAILRFRSTGSETEVGHATLGLAEARRAQGDIDLDAYRQASSIYEARQLRHSAVQCSRAFALALRSSGQYASANRLLAKARRSAARHKLTAELAHLGRLIEDQSTTAQVPLNFP
ncbi:trypsin-like peptidase domain-containing protein [Micromonospora sp. NPDC048905]|uniref:trypsin-like peptidase domain-containing protein n=1 Tax=Micromonospora sp. NPDC048905 TaxID=3155494 RepID=UPI00340F9DEF